LAPSISLAHGAAVPLGGVPHPVLHEPNRRGGAFVENGAIIVTGTAEFLPRRLRDFLRTEAKRRILPLAAIHAEKLGVAIKAIRVKDTQSRWGSCAPDGTLAFSWRLVMAPDTVLDYVVAHEVAHLRELNHSPRFWAHVAALAPHRDEAEAWLREEGPALLRVG
jgi:predicted metal-dependent hydrolase